MSILNRENKDNYDFIKTKKKINRKFPEIKIGITPLFNDLEFEFETFGNNYTSARTPYLFKNIKDIENIKNILIEFLNECLEKDISILVLPELTINDFLLDEIKKWLKNVNLPFINKNDKGIILLIASSFHFDIGERKYVNRSTVLNYAGNVLWNHDKLQAFQITSDEIVKPEWAEWKNKIGLNVNGGEENICCGNSLSFFDSELGRIGITICLDYIYPTHMSMLQYSKINLFLVPCMSPTITRFKKSAETLGDCQQASLFLSNCGAIAKKDKNGNIDEDGASFYYLPKKTNSYIFNENNATLKIFDLSELIKS